ncbi:MAG: LysR family transcriptional regulator [Carnobacterium sp.]|nr:LysR family transcriptional regulator [Carnobacterium sp.]
MIDYRYKTFSVLADILNYTKTAEFLNLSQPAVTKHIQYLEHYLETQLFYYEHRRLTLTEKGRYLKKELDIIEQETSQIKAELIRDSTQKSLSVGASYTIGEYFILDKLQQFSLTEKNTKVDLTVNNTKNLLELLDQRKIDVALISGPLDVDHYDSKVFFEDSIVAICSPEHPLAGSKNSLFSDLKNEKILLREKGSGIFSALVQSLSRNHLSLGQFSRCASIGNIHLIKELVKKIEGISFLYAISIADDLAKKSLSTISLTDFSETQSFFLVSNKTDHPNKLQKKFEQIFLEKKVH